MITGGPSTGKTTLIDHLAKLGYATVPEAARLMIDERIQAGETIEHIRADEQAFQEAILRRKASIEAQLDPHRIYFLDRGMHDTTAYLQYYHFPVQPWATKLINQASYRKVFVLEPLPTYTQDYSRTEDETFRQTITDLFCKAYQAGGIEVIRVPAMSIAKRTKLILQNVAAV